MIGIVDSGQKIIGSNIALHLDASQLRSYGGSGTVWTDLSGNGRNATISGSPTFSSTNGGHFAMDGINDNASCSSISFWNLGSSCTISIWSYYTTNIGGQNILLSFEKSGFRGWMLTGLGAFFYANSPNEDILNLQIPPSGFDAWVNNTWYNWVIVINRSTGFYTTYSQGVQRNNAAITAPVITNSNTLFIGNRGDNTDWWYNSNIAQVLFYSSALSGTEVLQNYNATKRRFGL